MKFIWELYNKYLHLNLTNYFFYFSQKHVKTSAVFCSNNFLLYQLIHIKFSTLFYLTQLTELFVYEAPYASASKSFQTLIVVYNFHTLLHNRRFFLFSPYIMSNVLGTLSASKELRLASISNLFLNANWLEREAGELHGLVFLSKKDLRNLMLPYGDTSAPFQKIVPVVGFKEIFYDSTSDLLVQSPVSLQF